jgi:hypothetical protein
MKVARRDVSGARDDIGSALDGCAVTVTCFLPRWNALTRDLRTRFSDGEYVIDILRLISAQVEAQIRAAQEAAAPAPAPQPASALDSFLAAALNATVEELAKQPPVELPCDGRVH